MFCVLISILIGIHIFHLVHIHCPTKPNPCAVQNMMHRSVTFKGMVELESHFNACASKTLCWWILGEKHTLFNVIKIIVVGYTVEEYILCLTTVA